jgi:hypothetical protein
MPPAALPLAVYKSERVPLWMPAFAGSMPITWVTDYSAGDIGNTFGPNGFSIGSNRHVSSSK